MTRDSLSELASAAQSPKRAAPARPKPKTKSSTPYILILLALGALVAVLLLYFRLNEVADNQRAEQALQQARELNAKNKAKPKTVEVFQP